MKPYQRKLLDLMCYSEYDIVTRYKNMDEKKLDFILTFWICVILWAIVAIALAVKFA